MTVELYLQAGRYLYGITEAQGHFGKMDCALISPKMVRDWAMKRYDKPSMINRAGISPVKAVLNFAAELHWCGPCRIPPVDEPKKRKRKAATKEWTRAMLPVLMSKGKYHGLPQLLMFGQLTGRRVDSLTQMRWENIDWQQSICVIPKDKTSKGASVEVPIPKDLVFALLELRREQEELVAETDPQQKLHWRVRDRMASGYVFGFRSKNVIWKSWKEACEEAGIDYVTPHEAIRHTFATVLHDRGWSANDIAAAGGWKSVALVQQVYIHSRKTVANAADILSEAMGAGHDVHSLIDAADLAKPILQE